VLAVPPKRADRTTVCFLTADEADALVAAPDRARRTGRRDHALLVLATQTGLRVSELCGVRRRDLHLGTGAHVDAFGKGRKQRSTPLTRTTVAVLRAWLAECGVEPEAPVFPGPRGGPLTRDAVHDLVVKHAATAAGACPTLRSKRVTPR